VLAAIPDALLVAPPFERDAPSPDALRGRYRSYLLTRLAAPPHIRGAALYPRERHNAEPPRPISARR
jgi:hypothetical protein